MTGILFRIAMIGLCIVPVAASAQPTAPAVKKPTVQTPNVTAPTTPSSSAPIARTAQPLTGAMAAQPFNEFAFKAATEADAVVFLVFSQAGDSVWETQAPLMKMILKESEFSKIASFEIDLKNAELATRFLVTTPGTILVMKGGAERIRSQRMIKADVIRKMLRLQSAL